MVILPAIGLLLATAPFQQREILKVPYVMPRPVFERLLTIQATEKDQFMTSEAFERRRQAARDSLFRGGRTFLVAETTAKYDADAGQLTLTSGFNPPTDADALAYPASIVVALELEDKGAYVEQNVFGAEERNTRVELNLYKLVIDNSKESLEGLYDAGQGTLKVTIPMPPNVARRHTSNLRLLLELIVPKPVKFEVAEPFVRDPTADSPFEATILSSRVSARLWKVIVFDAATREVFLVRRLN